MTVSRSTVALDTAAEAAHPKKLDACAVQPVRLPVDAAPASTGRFDQVTRRDGDRAAWGERLHGGGESGRRTQNSKTIP